MILSVLASGSTGNCTYIKTGDLKILVDVGTNMTYIKSQLQKINVDLMEINYIFLTHVHSDHTSALECIVKNYHPMIVLSKLMYHDLKCLKKYDNLLFYNQDIVIDNLKVELIKTSHDASDSRGFIFSEEEKSLVYITDTGYLNSRYFDILGNREAYVFESNHDIERLIKGKYPKWLQNRILSDVGHLSNNASSFYLSKLIGPKTKKIILAHLSQENNTESLALETITNVFMEKGITFNDIIMAKPTEQTGEIEI